VARKPLKAGPEAELAQVRKTLDAKRSALEKLQERLRANSNDAKTREKVQAAKAEIVPLTDQEADLQRAIGKAAGGREFTV
jgi:hypothetical protein